MITQERYKMNMGVLNEDDLKKLQTLKVVIVGLGGLGGYLANQMIRLGLLHVTLIDFDRFTESNLNRQLFSNMNNIGEYKVDVIAKELKKINPKAKIIVKREKIQDLDFIEGDYLIDCSDNKETKIYLSRLSQENKIPLLHGACGGWYGQVGWMSPSCTLLEDLYSDEEKGLETRLLNPPYIVNAVASVMVSEFIKMIKNHANVMMDEILFIDLLDNDFWTSGGHKHG